MTFKEKTVETFITNVKIKIPHLTEHELTTMKLSFESGFNMGYAQDKGEIEQGLALMLLNL